MKITVIGAGPSGLMAAWAAVTAGHQVTLYDRNPGIVSRNHGVFYLHSDCGLSLPSQKIITTVLGATDLEEAKRLYAIKVYGDEEMAVSVGSGIDTVYRSDYAINWLLNLFKDEIHERTFRTKKDIRLLLDYCDKVIVTIPADKLLSYSFDFSVSYVRHTACEQGDVGRVWYNVGEGSWTRMSQVFGVQAVESIHPGPDFHMVKKVVTAPDEVFDEMPEVMWEGRFGRWDKSILTHTVYGSVLRQLDQNG